jgi:hypothetical protein
MITNGAGWGKSGPISQRMNQNVVDLAPSVLASQSLVGTLSSSSLPVNKKFIE